MSQTNARLTNTETSNMSKKDKKKLEKKQNKLAAKQVTKMENSPPLTATQTSEIATVIAKHTPKKIDAPNIAKEKTAKQQEKADKKQAEKAMKALKKREDLVQAFNKKLAKLHDTMVATTKEFNKLQAAAIKFTDTVINSK